MKIQFNKILKIIFIISLLSFSKSYSIEDITEFTEAINDAREEISNVSKAVTEVG